VVGSSGVCALAIVSWTNSRKRQNCMRAKKKERSKRGSKSFKKRRERFAMVVPPRSV